MDTVEIVEQKPTKRKVNQPYWLIYLSLLLAGALLVGQAYNIAELQKWTARIGLAFIFSAVALLVGNGRWAGFFAAAVIWIAVLVTYLS